MILEYISEKVNQIIVSQAAEGDGLSPVLAEGKINVKDEIYWMVDTQVDGTAWIQINFFEATDIYETTFNTNGLYADVEVQWSIDGINWYTLPRATGNRGWTGYTDVKVVYMRLMFTDLAAGFELDAWTILGDENFTINDQLISITARKYYPQRFFEQKQMIPETVQTYLEMLERNDKGGTIKSWLPGECTVEVFLIFDEGEEGEGAINSQSVNAIAINSAAGTTYTGLGAAIINRIAGGGAFYNLDGEIVPNGIGLRFNSVVSCEELTAGENIQYKWQFNDPHSSSINPTTVVVNDYGEIIHIFTHLGYYDVVFTVQRGGIQFSATQRVEILPSPYIIVGPAAAVNGATYTVFGLTNWPFMPTDATTPGSYQPPIITDSTGVEISSAIMYLTDNGDRTFTLTRLSEPPDSHGYIKIYDEFYGEWKELPINFQNVLTDSNDDYILDSQGNFIYTS